MLDEARRSEFLPVVVLGPTKVDEQFVDETNKLWDELAQVITSDPKLDDIPIIDLRTVQVINYNRFAANGKQASIDLLGDGYEKLRARIKAAIEK